MSRILVTGGAGFIGSNFIKYMMMHFDYDIINFDALTYAGNLENLKEIESSENYTFIKGDIRNIAQIEPAFQNGIDYIINFAAESHVDRSIHNPSIFVETNVNGTLNLLELSKKYGVQKYIQISTDEVYGSLGKDGLFTEDSQIKPNSPYAASKASADLLVKAYYETYNLPVNITRCSNNYGAYQFPEKLIPLVIHNAMNGKKIPIYGDGKQIRDWLHVEDHCRAIEQVLHKGKLGEIYNIGGNNEKENIELIEYILRRVGADATLKTHIADRLGHDRRYAIDASKIRHELGWNPKYDFESGMNLTIDWYLNNEEWLNKVISEEYRNYYSLNYDYR